MSLMIIAILGVIVVAAFMIVPRISGGLGLGANAKAGTGGNGNMVSAGGDTGRMIDVSGNGCACSNGVCEGNCSEMEQIDLQNFDPKDWVEQNT